MRLGIFAKTFARSTVEQTIDAVRSHGLDCVQFNMACAGTLSMPDRIDPQLCDRIRAACGERGVTISAVSGTFNMIHPDMARRADGLSRLRVLTAACARMGTSVVTLCTGSRDAENMWRHHPENDSPVAWKDLCASMSDALATAAEHRVTLGIEPEVSNVLSSASKARRLLDEMRSPWLKIIIDPANLFPAGTLSRMRDILREAFDLLGTDLVIAHAKDLAHDGAAGDRAAGTGVLDYDLYLSLLRQTGFDGPLILHGLSEQEVPRAIEFVRGKLAGIEEGKSC